MSRIATLILVKTIKTSEIEKKMEQKEENIYREWMKEGEWRMDMTQNEIWNDERKKGRGETEE